jgi:hypothetical protein
VEENVTLEWTFTPEDFFEVPFEHKGERCTFDIQEGKVIADVSAIAENEYTNIHDELNGLFLGAQLIEHGSYTLSDFAIIRIRPDGTRNIGVSVKSASIVTVSGKAEFVITDAEGNVKHDSRAERIQNRREVAALAAKHRADPVAVAILKSYRAAAEESRIELIRLYEIRDALAKHFGEGDARKVLGISKNDWSRLGYLANEAPLNQGRHRGKKVGELRDATDAELNEARKIAQGMIRAYLKQIENKHSR